jgi:hypothetical protein
VEESVRVHECDYGGGRNENGGHNRGDLNRRLSELDVTGGEEIEEPCVQVTGFWINGRPSGKRIEGKWLLMRTNHGYAYRIAPWRT